MSEQTLIPQLHNVVSEATGASAGTDPLIGRGNVAPATGNIVPGPAPAKPDMQILVKRLNLAALKIGRDLHFEVDLDKGLAVIQVLDRQTGDIVRQIPAEKASLAIRENGEFRIRLLDALI